MVLDLSDHVIVCLSFHGKLKKKKNKQGSKLEKQSDHDFSILCVYVSNQTSI